MKNKIKVFIIKLLFGKGRTINLSNLDFKGWAFNASDLEADVIYNTYQKAEEIYNNNQQAEVINNYYQGAEEANNNYQIIKN